jgi:uncharacterized membrane protein YdjX (TVP38/TMEM64 family)
MPEVVRGFPDAGPGDALGVMQAPATATTRLPIRRIGLILLASIGLILAGRRLGDLFPRFAMWVDGFGVWGPVLFIAGYIVATVAFAPGSVLTLAAGAIFGLLEGTIYVLVGATIGSVAAFLVARYAARAAVEQKLAGNPGFAAIDRAVGSSGFKIVLLLRLSPVFPFNLLNYALGLTNVRLRDYALASIGMLPGALLYIYYGKIAGDVVLLAGGMAGERGPGYYVVLTVGLVATGVVTTVVTRVARRALAEATQGNSKPATRNA